MIFPDLLHLSGFVRQIMRRFFSENLMQVSAALAFTTLLGMVPLLALVIVVVGWMPFAAPLFERLEWLFQESFVPGGAGGLIAGNIERFLRQAQKLTWVGLGIISITAFLLIHTIEKTFNALWGVPNRPLLARLRLYGFLMLFFPAIFAVVIAIFSYALTVSLGVFEELSVFRALQVRVISFFVGILFFSFLYHALPNKRVGWKSAFLGGAWVAAMFALLQKLFEWYLIKSALLKSIYGAFAMMPVFLIWLQISWGVVLIGGLVVSQLTPRSEA